LRSFALKAGWAAIAAVVAVGAIPSAHAATDEMQLIKRLPVNYPKNADTIDPPSGSMVMNPAARRAYQIFKMTDGGYIIRTLNLDTLTTIRETRVPFQLVTKNSASAAYITALNTERNLLYLPYSTNSFFGGIAVFDGDTGKVTANYPRDVAHTVDPRNNVIGTDPESGDPYVCTSANCRPQVPGAAPNIFGISYVPSILTGLTPKILMLWADVNGPSLQDNSAIVWVTQWDAATGHEDWVYRVQACQNRLLPIQTGQYPLAIFQARLGTGIYLGCNASGGTGQVVRLTVDSTNQPQTEEAFPGPTNVADVIADENDDRLLFHVANEEGDSWWVFNGLANAYSGVIGVTLALSSTSAGVDPDSGRLYMLAPPSHHGQQNSLGGLLISDVRRSPAPQALSFEKFANNGFYGIGVDPRAPGGTRRAFVRVGRSSEILVVQDNVAITSDPPLTDLDRFTTDVQEQPGVTNSSFTGSGHGYGLRASFLSGAEAIPPGGPDLSGIRVGRFVPEWAGSPCGAGDRRLVLGQIQSTSLSNSIANASATTGDVDPGTGTDVAQPVQRCYPHPVGPNNTDPFPAVFGGNYPRPLDKDSNGDGTSDADSVAGNPWPFGVSQCSNSGEKRSAGSSLRPADRGDGDTVPKDVRDQEIAMDGYRSDVSCLLNPKADVLATAQAASFQKDKPAQGVDYVSFGEVSSRSHVYLDAARGLVSESIAVVRDINIGNKVFIDSAFTYAEAHAHGRPGTASTTFIRRLCGVRVPDAKIHADVVDLSVGPVHVGDPLYDNVTSKVAPNGVDVPATPSDSVPQHVDPYGLNLGDAGLDQNQDDVNQDGVDWDVCGDPSTVNSAGAATGSQTPILDQINKALGSRGRVYAPQPDPELRQGTPGGYLASVQKNRLEQVGARSVNNDDSTQVPALEIVMFNDDPTQGRGRQIYQLAGVDASVTYGIYLLNPEQPGGPLPEILPSVAPGPYIPPPPTPEPPFEPQGPTGPLGPIGMFFSGVGFLLRSPIDALLAAAVWAILFAPVQLSMRRRALRGLA
jgi:hypothetical protein